MRNDSPYPDILLTGHEDPAELAAIEYRNLLCDVGDRRAVRRLLAALHELRGDPWPATPRTYIVNADRGLCMAWLDVSRRQCTPEQWDAHMSEAWARGLERLKRAEDNGLLYPPRPA
jgi:hypothetical protein